jgi:hypothetical protein
VEHIPGRGGEDEVRDAGDHKLSAGLAGLTGGSEREDSGHAIRQNPINDDVGKLSTSSRVFSIEPGVAMSRDAAPKVHNAT